MFLGFMQKKKTTRQTHSVEGAVTTQQTKGKEEIMVTISTLNYTKQLR